MLVSFAPSTWMKNKDVERKKDQGVVLLRRISETWQFLTWIYPLVSTFVNLDPDPDIPHGADIKGRVQSQLCTLLVY
jgi:hypothetical protein